MLTSALEASPPSLKSQIHYIISQLNSEDTPPQDDDGDETPPTDDSADEEDEEEGDVVEGDEDEVAIATSGLVGESLLVQYVINRKTCFLCVLRSWFVCVCLGSL